MRGSARWSRQCVPESVEAHERPRTPSFEPTHRGRDSRERDHRPDGPVASVDGDGRIRTSGPEIVHGRPRPADAWADDGAALGQRPQERNHRGWSLAVGHSKDADRPLDRTTETDDRPHRANGPGRRANEHGARRDEGAHRTRRRGGRANEHDARRDRRDHEVDHRAREPPDREQRRRCPHGRAYDQDRRADELSPWASPWQPSRSRAIQSWSNTSIAPREPLVGPMDASIHSTATTLRPRSLLGDGMSAVVA
jgi:hypothetical protein